MREDTGEPAFAFMEARSDMEGSFDDLETGDTIQIKVALIHYDDTRATRRCSPVNGSSKVWKPTFPASIWR